MNGKYLAQAINFGQIRGSVPGFKFANRTLGEVVTDLVPWIFALASFVLLLLLLSAGFQYMTSRGDQNAVAAAKAKLTNAFIGFLVIFSAFFIIQIVARILNIPALKGLFG